MSRLGREFEEAVYEFVKTLDPSAEVLFDHSMPDRDTQSLRQCDVWINAKFNQHWPLSILVSCKDHTRKLHVGDIGAFSDEVRSVGASMGVIYSKSGFTKAALQKAKANGFACCRLYKNEPPDIPSSIWFDYFACTPQINVEVISDLSEFPLVVWNDVFDIQLKDGGYVVESISKVFHEGEKFSINQIQNKIGFPPGWSSEIKIGSDEKPESFSIKIDGNWKIYRSKTEATMINGSYSFSNDNFKGQICGPWIDTQGPHIGEHWIEIDKINFTNNNNSIMYILHSGDIEKALRSKIGTNKIDIKL